MQKKTALSSSGLGRVVLSHQTGVRFPVALPNKSPSIFAFFSGNQAFSRGFFYAFCSVLKVKKNGSFTRRMKRKKLPVFKTEEQERAFWAKESPLDYFDLSKAHKAVFPNLKPTLKSISIRLPIDIIENLKVLANKQDVPYQSLAKIYLGRQIQLEKHPTRSLHHSAHQRQKAKSNLV